MVLHVTKHGTTLLKESMIDQKKERKLAQAYSYGYFWLEILKICLQSNVGLFARTCMSKYHRMAVL